MEFMDEVRVVRSWMLIMGNVYLTLKTQGSYGVKETIKSFERYKALLSIRTQSMGARIPISELKTTAVRVKRFLQSTAVKVTRYFRTEGK